MLQIRLFLADYKMECDSGSDLPVRPEEPPPETGGGEGDASTSLLPAVPAVTVSPNLPVLPLLPLAARLHKLSCETASDEPKAGPSNSAAQFDLEVCPLVFTACAFDIPILEERVVHTFNISRFLTLDLVVQMKSVGKGMER